MNAENTLTQPIQLQTNEKAAIYIRRAAPRFPLTRRDQREMTTQTLVDFAHQQGWSDENLLLFNDSSLPATSPIDEREGLQQLIQTIEAGEMKAVLLLSEHSLWRDATFADVHFFVELCKRQNVLVITQQIIYDFSNPNLARLFCFTLEARSFSMYAPTTVGKRFHQNREPV